MVFQSYLRSHTSLDINQQILRPFLLSRFGMVASSLHDVHVRLANKSEKDGFTEEIYDK